MIFYFQLFVEITILFTLLKTHSFIIKLPFLYHYPLSLILINQIYFSNQFISFQINLLFPIKLNYFMNYNFLNIFLHFILILLILHFTITIIIKVNLMFIIINFHLKSIFFYPFQINALL